MKKELKRNYMKFVSIFVGLQALALMMAINRLNEFGQKGLPLEMITLVGMSWTDPFMIAFLLAVITGAMVVIFGYQDILSIGKSPTAVRRKYVTFTLMAISIAMVLLFVPYLVPVNT